MKKIILLLALALGVEVKGQIVGGFVPINSSKSFTAGNSTFSNVIARGTLSVGSTATVMGVITTNSIVANSGQLRLYSGSSSDLILRAVGASQAITSEINGSPKFQVTSNGATVTGSLITTGTHSLGSANLTGGNTGTVAVLSDAVFGVNCMVTSSNPADATSYTCGITPFTFTGFNTGKVYMPYNCTLVGWTFSAFTNGTPGSAESGSLSININGTSTQLSSAIITSVAVVEYSASGLSTSVNAGNYINAIFTTPTWGTNPTSIALGITFWFVRRS